MKKLHLILFGKSAGEYNHWSGARYFINYRVSYYNYKEYIIDYFKSIGYDVQIYYYTNSNGRLHEKSLESLYSPISHKYNCELRDIGDFCHYTKACELRNLKLQKAIDVCLNFNKNKNVSPEDMVFITRFDLQFKIPFEKYDFNYQKINLHTRLEHEEVICDNMYFFNYKYLFPFNNMVKSNLRISAHCWEQQIRDTGPIHFCYPENGKRIEYLNTYGIVRVPCVDKKGNIITWKNKDDAIHMTNKRLDYKKEEKKR